jgi:hypothetical protein
MPTNLIKKYPDLLEILHLSESLRNKSLQAIFNRDICYNDNFKFRAKQLRPFLLDGEAPMGTLFNHLTREEVEEVAENDKKFKKRIFEKDRSMRLHWIRFHIEEHQKKDIEIFSVIERDMSERKDVKMTYIYNLEQKYVIVLMVRPGGLEYFFKSAYYLNRDYGEKAMQKKLKKKLAEIL